MGFYSGRDGRMRCDNCGAPPSSGLAACPYCKMAYLGVAAGVTCRRCHVTNARGQSLCAGCNLAITRACVFCQTVSPLDSPACVRCREPFEGAEARLQARRDAEKRKQYMALASQGLGAAVTVATSPAGSSLLSSILDAITDD